MDKTKVTEISESDFRRLNLKAYRMRQGGGGFEEVGLNDVLDEELCHVIKCGFQGDREELLEVPVTVAIHKDNSMPRDLIVRSGRFSIGYFDKFMDAYTGPATFEMAFGIPHVYSTRLWFEARDWDYWRVRREDTSAIYRIRLDRSWADRFVELRKSEKRDERQWVDKDTGRNAKGWVEDILVREDADSEWKLEGTVRHIMVEGGCHAIIGIAKGGSFDDASCAVGESCKA